MSFLSFKKSQSGLVCPNYAGTWLLGLKVDCFLASKSGPFQQEDVSVQLEALDILGDLLSRFGGLLIQFHPNLLEALSPQLKSPRLAVRKRSIIALGHLVMSCDQTLYLKLINMLMEELAASNGGQGSAQNTRTYIQAIGGVCRQAGHRFGDHVERVVPLVLR